MGPMMLMMLALVGAAETVKCAINPNMLHVFVCFICVLPICSARLWLLSYDFAPL